MAFRGRTHHTFQHARLTDKMRACLLPLSFFLYWRVQLHCPELHFDKYLGMEARRTFNTGLCGSGILYAGSITIAPLKSSKLEISFLVRKGSWQVVIGCFWG